MIWMLKKNCLIDTVLLSTTTYVLVEKKEINFRYARLTKKCKESIQSSTTPDPGYQWESKQTYS